MDLHEDWTEIRSIVNKAFASHFHVSIGSVDQQGQPTVTPIGSLFLYRDPGGFYFEKYPSKLPVHAKQNQRICILAVNSSPFFWLGSLFRGKFSSAPAIKLYGSLGDLRNASAKDIARLRKRMRKNMNR
jgi:hypothetical protein